MNTPQGWKKVKFGQLAKEKSNRVDKPDESGYERYVGLEHLDSGNLIVKRWGSTKDVNSAMKLFNENDILFARRNTYLRRVSVAQFNGVCSGDIIVIEPILKEIVEGFLPILMQFEPFENRVISLSAGAFSKRIKWNQLAEEEIVIPPKEEQKRIVKLLWALEDHIEKTNNLISINEKLKKGLLNELLKINTKYGSLMAPKNEKLPKDFSIKKVSECVLDIKNGFASGQRDDNGIVQIRMNNIGTDGSLNFVKYLKVPIPKNISTYDLNDGDILFNNTNSIELVGKSTIFRTQNFPCTFSNHFTRLRTDKELILPELLHYHLVTYRNAGIFEKMAQRHVGQCGVSIKDVLNIRIPLPPLIEQKKILIIIQTFNDQVKQLSAHLTNISSLKKKFTDELISGELRLD